MSVAGQNVPLGGTPLPGENGAPGTPGQAPGAPQEGESEQSQGEGGEGADVNVNVDVAGGNMPSIGQPGTPGTPGAPGTSTAGGVPGTPGTGTSAGAPGGNDPFGGLGRSGTGPMTAAERRAVLDGRLEASYAVFDGIILGERERAQRDADAAGAAVMGTGGGGEGAEEGSDAAGGAEGGNESPTIVASNTRGAGAGVSPNGATGREGEFDNSAATYPPPGDIPSGDDDDVVARQLREAAMREPDPELREKLWDEYRKYTGLSQ